MHEDLSEILLDAESIAARVEAMAEELARRLAVSSIASSSGGTESTGREEVS